MMTEFTVLHPRKDTRVKWQAIALLLLGLLGAIGFNEYMDANPFASLSERSMSVPSTQQIEDAGMTR